MVQRTKPVSAGEPPRGGVLKDSPMHKLHTSKAVMSAVDKHRAAINLYVADNLVFLAEAMVFPWQSAFLKSPGEVWSRLVTIAGIYGDETMERVSATRAKSPTLSIANVISAVAALMYDRAAWSVFQDLIAIGNTLGHPKEFEEYFHQRRKIIQDTKTHGSTGMADSPELHGDHLFAQFLPKSLGSLQGTIPRDQAPHLVGGEDVVAGICAAQVVAERPQGPDIHPPYPVEVVDLTAHRVNSFNRELRIFQADRDAVGRTTFWILVPWSTSGVDAVLCAGPDSWMSWKLEGAKSECVVRNCVRPEIWGISDGKKIHRAYRNYIIDFQRGALKTVGFMGITVEALLAVVMAKLRDTSNAQRADERSDTEHVLDRLQEARLWLLRRHVDMESRGDVKAD